MRLGSAVSLLLCVSLAPAATVTVCASGCDYTSAQAAIDAAAADRGIDVVELRAGETFAGNISLPNRHISKHHVTIRSSRWRELPPQGTRVSYTAHSALMPKITGNQSPHGSAMTAWPVGGGFTASASTNVLTECSGGYVYPENGHRVVVQARTGYTLPEPLQAGTTYWVVGRSGATWQLAATPGGTAIDLTTDGSGGCELFHGTLDPPSNYTLRGIWFQATAGQYNGNLLWLGYGNAIPRVGPANITISQCVIRGEPTEFTQSNQNGVTAIGASYVIQDSHLEHFKYTAEESHAISLIGHGAGPFLFRNNFLSAASIGILVGGASKANIEHDHVIDGVIIQANHVYKHGYYSYHSGTGAPSGTCAPAGRFYRDTVPNPNTCANGACYVCQANGTWAQDTGATYRSGHLLNKGGVEFKGCRNCIVEGNVVENTFDGYDTGNVSCIVPVAGQSWQQIIDVTIRSNYCLSTYAGIAAATANGNNPGQRIRIENNVLVGQGDCDRSIYACGGGAHAWALRADGGREDIRVTNNTVREAGANSLYRNMDLAMMSPYVATNYVAANNMVSEATSPLFMDGSDSTCGAGGIGRYMDVSGGAPYPLRNNVLFGTRNSDVKYASCVTNLGRPDAVSFVSATNHRLAPGGPYSADCVAGCAFAGTDGRDIGADIDVWENAISGAVSGAPPWSVQAGLDEWTEQGLRHRADAVVAGSTRAMLRFRRVAGGACTVRLYTNAARTVLHADTDAAGEQDCGRSGNLADGPVVTAVLGTNTTLTAATTYYWRIVDGTRVMVGELRTRAAGGGAAPWSFQWPTSRTLSYSSSADMSDPTVLGAAGAHTVSVAEGAVLYVEPAGGNRRALVN